MNNAQAQRDKDRRVFTLAAIILAGVTLLLVGLWYVQVATALIYIEDQEIQSMRTVRVPAVRGSILDIHGRPLAQDKPTFVINAYLEELRHHFRDEWRNSQPEKKLSASENSQLEIAVRHRVLSHFTEQLTLNHPIGDTPKQLQLRFAENNWRVPGLELEVAPKRHYPSRATAHLTGHLMRNNVVADINLPYNYRLPDYAGKIGLEKTFDHYLRG